MGKLGRLFVRRTQGLFLTARVCCSSLTANIFEAIGSIATNNKGELSAFCHALTGARELARPGEEVLILSDSERDLHHDWRMYGAWALRKNKALWSSATGEP